MNQKQHKRRHQTLNAALAELFADFVKNSGYQGNMLKVPMAEVILWSHRQSNEPAHEDISHGSH